MKKKIALTLAAAGTAVALLPMFAAFEAHVINVTAKIENALAVSTDSIDFGTVFPQEELEQDLHIQLSQSFLDEPRVDDVEYIIRQKPKCGWTDNDGTNLLGLPTATGHVFPGEIPADTGFATQFDGYYVQCPDPGSPLRPEGSEYGVLPSLCPYLSKHKSADDPDSNQEEVEIDAFHHPWTIGDGVEWLDAHGRLAKSDDDSEDWWVIDLKVPCFGDHCAQDWEEFVRDINPGALPADQWTQDIADEHKVFGCDLWVEVNEVSEARTITTLRVVKEVINDAGGDAVVADFPLFIDAGAVTSGDVNEVSAGAHVVTETGVAGYDATFGGDCDTDGNVTLAAGESKTCTITNDDIAPSITLTKVVQTNGDDVPGDFTMRIDGEIIPSGSSKSVTANAIHTISEDDFEGFVGIISGADCPDTLPGDVILDLAENISCTITNTQE